MAADPNLALSIFDYVLDLSLKTLPYQEKPKPKSKKETIRVATTQAIAVFSLSFFGNTESLRGDIFLVYLRLIGSFLSKNSLFQSALKSSST